MSQYAFLLESTSLPAHSVPFSWPSDRRSFCVLRLQLLNTTVSSLAVTINNVLTQTYNAIYGIDDDGGEELNLLVSPLSSVTELQALYAGGLIDFETALPPALHSLGCTAEEISAALDRRRELEKKQADMKALEEKTAKAELERRERDANKPDSEARKPNLEASKPAASSAPAKKASAPASPDSKKDGDSDWILLSGRNREGRSTHTRGRKRRE
jgi:hypothetical protein